MFCDTPESMRELWEDRRQKLGQYTATAKAELALLQRKNDQMMERIMNAESPALVSAYESQIVRLEEKKVSLNENIKSFGKPLASFDETFRTAITFLSNPCKIWENGEPGGSQTCAKTGVFEEATLRPK